jgi:hypothetical protein
MTNERKCAHPACECTVAAKGPFGKYCSNECKRAGQIAELHCNCQHPECRMTGQAGLEHRAPGPRL